MYGRSCFDWIVATLSRKGRGGGEEWRISGMVESKPEMRKPVFIKVDQLRPGTSGHTLTVKVVHSKMVLQKGRSDGPQARQMHIAECLVGDETGTIVFTARNDRGWNWDTVDTIPNDHYCWMRPENMDYPRPVYECHGCSDLADEITAALASASIVFKDSKRYSKKLVHGTETLEVCEESKII